MVKINGNAASTVALSLERALNESQNQYRELFRNADFRPLSVTNNDIQYYVAQVDDVTMTARRGFLGNWRFQAHCW